MSVVGVLVGVGRWWVLGIDICNAGCSYITKAFYTFVIFIGDLYMYITWRTSAMQDATMYMTKETYTRTFVIYIGAFYITWRTSLDVRQHLFTLTCINIYFVETFMKVGRVVC